MARTRDELDERENEALRVYVRGLVAKDFGGVESRFADVIDVSASTMNYFLSGRNGAGRHLIRRLEAHVGLTLKEMIGDVSATVEGTAWGRLEGWAEAEKAVRAQRDFPEWALREARKMRGLQPRVPVDEAFVTDAVFFVFRSIPKPELQKREDDRLDGAIERQVAKDTAAEKRKAAGPKKPKAQLALPAPPAAAETPARKPKPRAAKKPS